MKYGLLILTLLAGTAYGAVSLSRFTVTGAKRPQTSASPQKPKVAQGNGCTSVRVNATVDGKTVSLCVQGAWNYNAGINKFTAVTMPDSLFKSGFETSTTQPETTRRAP